MNESNLNITSKGNPPLCLRWVKWIYVQDKSICAMIIFHMDGENVTWRFEQKSERDRVFKHIESNYFQKI